MNRMAAGLALLLAGLACNFPILAQPDSPYCPVAALQAWVAAAKISEGAVFVRVYRSDTLSDKRLGAGSGRAD